MNPPRPPSCVWLLVPFRSGGTHFWNQLRSHPEWCGYYEPFNEILGAYRRPAFEQEFEEIRDRLHHDTSEREYFHEFPVDAEGKVLGYEDRFVADRNLEDGSDIAGATRNYLQSLMEAAEGRKVVFKCCRATFRAAGLLRSFPSTCITVFRNPRDQFISFNQFPERYFDASLLMLTGLHAREERIRPLFEICPVTELTAGTAMDKIYTYQSVAKSLPVSVRFAMLYFWWWQHLLETAPLAEFLIDVNHAAGNPILQKQLDEANIPIQTDRCISATYRDSDRDFPDFGKIEPWVEKRLAQSQPEACRRLLQHLESRNGFLSADTRQRCQRLQTLLDESAPTENSPAPQLDLPAFLAAVQHEFHHLHSSLRNLEARTAQQNERLREYGEVIKSLEKPRKRRWF